MSRRMNWDKVRSHSSLCRPSSRLPLATDAQRGLILKLDEHYDRELLISINVKTASGEIKRLLKHGNV